MVKFTLFHSFELYSSTNFHKCLYSYYCQNQDTVYFYPLHIFPCTPFWLTLSHNSQDVSDLISVPIVLPFQYYYANRIIQYELFSVWHLSVRVLLCVVPCISSSYC